jgi:hypothetical protein
VLEDVDELLVVELVDVLLLEDVDELLVVELVDVLLLELDEDDEDDRHCE